MYQFVIVAHPIKLVGDPLLHAGRPGSQLITISPNWDKFIILDAGSEVGEVWSKRWDLLQK